MYRFTVEVEGLALDVFKTLEREVNFKRGRLYVQGNRVVAEAQDLASLRSLLHTVFRSLYLVEFVEMLEG